MKRLDLLIEGLEEANFGRGKIVRSVHDPKDGREIITVRQSNGSFCTLKIKRKKDPNLGPSLIHKPTREELDMFKWASGINKPAKAHALNDACIDGRHATCKAGWCECGCHEDEDAKDLVKRVGDAARGIIRMAP